MKYSKTKLTFGLVLIALAALLIFDATGILPAGIDPVRIFILALGVSLTFHSLCDFSFPGIYSGIAIIYYTLSKMLKLPYVSIPVLFVVVVLLSIGSSLIIPVQWTRKLRERRYRKRRINTQPNFSNKEPVTFGNERTEFDFEKAENLDDADFAYCKNTFGATSKYITSSNLQGASFDCNFGEIKAYFDGSTISNPPIDITVHCSFGTIELYVPKYWKVNPIANVSLGNISEKNKVDFTNGPVVNLVGNISFGSVVIIYV